MSNPSKKIPTVTAKVAPDLRRYLERVREAIGEIDGGFDNRVISVIRRYASGGGGGDGGGDGGGPRPESPGGPTGLSAVSHLLTINVSWDKAGYYGHKHTELWAAPYHPENNPDPSISAATPLTVAVGTLFIHSVDAETGFRYWVRHVNVDDVYGPWSEPAEGFVTWVEKPPEVEDFEATAEGQEITVSWKPASFLGKEATEVYASKTQTRPEVSAGLTSNSRISFAKGLSETWYFWARHANVAGEYSEEFAGPVSATTYAGDLVPDMEDLVAQYIGERSVQLSWDGASYTGMDGVNIYRDGGGLLGHVEGTLYFDHHAPSLLSTTYKVCNVNSAGVEGRRATVTATTEIEPPSAPTRVTAERLYMTALVSWDYPTYKGHKETIVYANDAEVARVSGATYVFEPTVTQRGVVRFKAKHVNLRGAISDFSNTSNAVDLSALPAQAYLDILGEHLSGSGFYDDFDDLPFMRTDADGRIVGYGMGMSRTNESAFIVSADYFIVGAPGSAGISPFTVKTHASTVDGVTVPAGVYIDTAYIADASIDAAKIGDLSADKITSGTIRAGTITVAGALKSSRWDSNPSTPGWLLDSDGRLHAQGASINGVITATGGTFTGTVRADAGYFQGDLIGATLKSVTMSVDGELMTNQVASRFSGGGMYVGPYNGGVFFRVGNGASDSSKSRLEVRHAGSGRYTFELINNAGKVLLSSSSDSLYAEKMSVSNLKSDYLDVGQWIRGETGETSWVIQGNGQATFNGVTVRGHVEANSGHFSGSLRTATLDTSGEFKTNSATSWGNGNGMFIEHDSRYGSVEGLRWRVGGGRYDRDGYKGRIQWQGRSFSIHGPNGEVLLESTPAGGSINGVYIDNLSANKITSGTLTSKTLTLDGGAIQSKVFNASTGWRISGNGDAVFNSLQVRVGTGDIDANAVSFIDSNVFRGGPWANAFPWAVNTQDLSVVTVPAAPVPQTVELSAVVRISFDVDETWTNFYFRKNGHLLRDSNGAADFKMTYAKTNYIPLLWVTTLRANESARFSTAWYSPQRIPRGTPESTYIEMCVMTVKALKR